MEHVPTTESDDQKVFRIARELGISLEDAAVTCAGFELAFSDDGLRRAIFEIIDQLDESAAKKCEPLGLIINYTVELGNDGIRVGRYADEIPSGDVVDLTPSRQACIFLRITDDFPTQEFLGPMIVNRPDSFAEEQFSAGREVLTDSEINKLPSLDRRSTGQSCWPERGCPVGRGGLTYTDTTQSELPTELPSHWAKTAIPLGPIRLKFNERFPCVSATKSSSQPAALQAGNLAFQSKTLKPPHHLPPWAALPAGMPAFQSSGLSPPRPSENLGHSDRKMFLRPPANRRRDMCLTPGYLKYSRQDGSHELPRSLERGYETINCSGFSRTS